jgi:uroporphyrinogen-III synthase
MRLLVTRPQPGAERTAAALRALGHSVITAPVLRFEATLPDIPAGPWHAVLMTSASAARAMSAHPRLGELIACPVFAVGRSTAEAARDADFSMVTSADGDVQALLRLARTHLPGSNLRLLYLAGEDRVGDLAGALASHGFDVRTIEVYRAVASDTLTAEAVAALARGEIDAILHYSARSATVFVDLANRAGVWTCTCEAAHLCLSAQVAQPLIAAGAGIVRIAPGPDEAALFGLIRQTGGNQ